ncbi:unnamed protein product [Phyllotreta striolata]|uniref:tRNA (guanine(37)-N1)-methyltransferase n=1 Tax=Phyllotreta striolata TaxID=444603 RepID=A0A9P0DZW7_PHYSR|nr:unnamed protein product [Phyllotreta striolata]
MVWSLKFPPTSTVIRLVHTSNLIMKQILKPPDSIRGMVELNRHLVKKYVDVPCLSVKKDSLNSIVPLVKKFFLKIENFKSIQHINNENVDLYLSPELVSEWSDLPEELHTVITEKRISKEHFRVIRNFQLNYENFTADDLLKAILPEDKEGMSSFTKIGHIVHVNLREHLLPFKNVIGEILFDKIPGCTSVVNKVNSIDNTYRNFSMEVLKGTEDMLTTVKENHCSFKFDFSKVYWNSRLCTEHERIVKTLKEADVLFDVFAGVGPFSVPAARKRCIVYANDLNPESFKWLQYNASKNKLPDESFKSFNLDGKDFIKSVVKEYLPLHLKDMRNIYITMNLPALAVEFLTHFEGLFTNDELSDFENCPQIFVYCFVKGENYVELAENLVKNSFKCDISANILDIFRVRTVSSLKEMMRITIRLEKDILTGARRKRKLEEISDSEIKKIRCLPDNGQKQEEGR